MDVCVKLGLGEAQISLSSFVACRHPAESCGHNGLPLTPNSITIYGNSNYLTNLRHENLCTFLDCKRGKNERIITVSEYFPKSLHDVYVKVSDDIEDPIHEKEILDLEGLLKIARQVFESLAFLEHKGITHTNLDSSNILLTKSNDVRLFNFGLGHMTDYGKCVAFPIFGNPRLSAPEVFLEGPPQRDSTTGSNDGSSSPTEQMDSIAHISTEIRAPAYSSKTAVWRFGMILIEKIFNIEHLWPTLKIPQIIRKVMSFSHLNSGRLVLERILRDHNKNHMMNVVPDILTNLICECLQPDGSQRLGPFDILLSDSFKLDNSIITNWKRSDLAGNFPTLKLRCQNLNWPPENEISIENETALDVLSLQEIYYLWELAGGDVISELGKHGLMVTMPPIVALPKIVLGEGHLQGQAKEKCSLYDPCVVVTVSLNQLRSCLENLTIDDLYPLVTSMDSKNLNVSYTGEANANYKYEYEGIDQGRNGPNHAIDEVANLPLVIKERDVKYQFSRIVLYRLLLNGYPFKRPLIWKEARMDALPLYRKYIWASLLGIHHDVATTYAEIDHESWTPTDRQIEVDIPRCHQYNNLLASPEGHRKFKRVLKAWVVTNPQYVYWQGLDSLCAPFLYLNFNDEALAFACFSAFIPKYLYGMFRKDNAPVIQEYLTKFAHLQAFHDSRLFNHLDGIGFIPDLYAIPWVLTMFAHVFPLHSIFHLWDKLLLGNSSFPLCVALSILFRLRDRLLSAEFNDCILLFSDLPAIDIEICVKDSIQIFCSTPKSLTYRKYGSVDEVCNLSAQYPELSIQSITLNEQKSEKVARISGLDLLDLMGLSLKGQDSIKEDRRRYSRVIVLDVRQYNDFKLGALPDSFNCPAINCFSEDGQIFNIPREIHDILLQQKKEVICVVGSVMSSDAKNFAAKLLENNFNRVCLLHRGIEIFRSTSCLCVPNT